jgi:hypothetical protein|tara:strand:+ start:287 stop:439 length:153 start_codon:yes stop_codon:yes gene_type:complete
MVFGKIKDGFDTIKLKWKASKRISENIWYKHTGLKSVGMVQNNYSPEREH